VDTGTVLVLDPVGAPVHGELPATWRELGDQREVIWCDRGPDGFWTAARTLLDDLAGPVDIVASGQAVAAAMTLGREHTATVRSVLLVDPAAGEHPVSSAEAATADAEWQRHEAARIRAMADEGVRVHVVAHSWVGEDDRREPPLPLGHPVVAERVQAELTRAVSGRQVLERRASEVLSSGLSGVRTMVDQGTSGLRALLDSGALKPRALMDRGAAGVRVLLDHPPHPALPAGVFLCATVLDFLPGRHKHVAGVLIGLGVLVSLPAALADQEPLRGVGLACYVSSLWARARGRRWSGRVSALSGLVLTTGASGNLTGQRPRGDGSAVER